VIDVEGQFYLQDVAFVSLVIAVLLSQDSKGPSQLGAEIDIFAVSACNELEPLVPV
jgi:hypothetical protein